MVRDVIKYTSSAPHTFMPGLEVLSQLLPLPLPMQVQAPVAGNATSCFEAIFLYFLRSIKDILIINLKELYSKNINKAVNTSNFPIIFSFSPQLKVRYCWQVLWNWH